MIIIQAPFGNLGFHIIRAIHRRWPDRFAYQANGTWRNDNYRPDLIIPNSYSMSEDEIDSFNTLLTVPSLVLTVSTGVIPTSLLDQVPEDKIFYLTRFDREDETKTVFLHWLGNSINQFDHATKFQDQTDFYQSLWRQLTLHLLSVSPIDEIALSRIPIDQAIDFKDLGKITAYERLFRKVQEEFNLANPGEGEDTAGPGLNPFPSANDEQYAEILLKFYENSLLPVEFFASQYADFEMVVERIIELSDLHADYREALDHDQQSRFRNVMDFFAFKRGVWDYEPKLWDTKPEPWVYSI
jgi:hypothetical protein